MRRSDPSSCRAAPQVSSVPPHASIELEGLEGRILFAATLYLRLNVDATPGPWVRIKTANVVPATTGTGGVIDVGFGLNSETASIVKALINNTQFATADLEQVNTSEKVSKATQFSTVSIAQLQTSATSGAIKEAAVLDYASRAAQPLPSAAPVVATPVAPSGKLAAGLSLATAIPLSPTFSVQDPLFKINSFRFLALPGGMVSNFNVGKLLDGASPVLLAAMQQGDSGTLTIEAVGTLIQKLPVVNETDFFDLKFTDVTLGGMKWTSAPKTQSVVEALQPQTGGSAFHLTQTTGSTGDLGLKPGLKTGALGLTVAPKVVADAYALRVVAASSSPVLHRLGSFTLNATVNSQNVLSVKLDIKESFATGNTTQPFTAGTDFSDAKLLLRNSTKKTMTGMFDLGATTVTSVTDTPSGSTTHEAASFSSGALSMQLIDRSSTGLSTPIPGFS